MESKKVLVADDEIHIVQVVAMKLRNNGFDVVTAEDGDAAYELCLQERPDLVITDHQMPGMTGIELIEKIRRTDEIRDTAVMMLTARGFAIEPQQQSQLEIAAFLSKPFSPKELLSNVEQILHSSIAQ